MMRICIVAVPTALLLFSAFARADDSGSWVGKKVMVTAADVKLVDPGDKGDVETAPLRRFEICDVLKEKGDRIRLRQDGTEGWIARKDAVLLEDAPDFFAGWIRKDPKDAMAYHWRAWAYAANNDFDRAIKDYDESIRLNPKNSQALMDRGRCHVARKDYDRAIHDFDEIVRLDPSNGVAYLCRGQVYFDQSKYDRAVKDYTSAIGIDPKDARSFHSRGMARACLKDYEQAISDYKEAIRIDPMLMEPYNNIAWIWATCADKTYRDGKKAVEFARKACELSEWKHPTCLDTLAAACAENGEFEKAVKWQKKVLEDKEYEKTYGKEGRERLKLFEAGKPFRD